MLLAALLLLGAEPASGASDGAAQVYPWREVTEAFATACSGAENPSVNRASAEAAGWRVYEPTEGTPMGAILAFGAKAMADEELDEGETAMVPLPVSAYRRTVAGRSLELVISGAKVADVSTFGCRVYDLEAREVPDRDWLESWMHRPASNVTQPAKGLHKFQWNGGLKPGHFELDIGFVEEGAEFPFAIPLTGLVMTATAMEIEGI